MKSRDLSLWLFAEGTRSMREYHDMLPFKKGAFHIAIRAGVPIVPIVVENYWRLYRKDVFESGTIKVKGMEDWFSYANASSPMFISSSTNSNKGPLPR